MWSWRHAIIYGVQTDAMRKRHIMDGQSDTLHWRAARWAGLTLGIFVLYAAICLIIG